MKIQHLMGARGLRRRRGMIGKVFGDGKGRYGKDLLFLHQAHRLVAKLRGMVNGGDACTSGIEGARLARRVDRNPLTGTRSLLNRSAEFGLGELIGSGKLAVPKRIPAGFIDLDEVRALL